MWLRVFRLGGSWYAFPSISKYYYKSDNSPRILSETKSNLFLQKDFRVRFTIGYSTFPLLGEFENLVMPERRDLAANPYHYYTNVSNVLGTHIKEFQHNPPTVTEITLQPHRILELPHRQYPQRCPWLSLNIS